MSTRKEIIQVVGILVVMAVYPLALLVLDFSRFLEVNIEFDEYSFEKIQSTSYFVWLFFVPFLRLSALEISEIGVGGCLA